METIVFLFKLRLIRCYLLSDTFLISVSTPHQLISRSLPPALWGSPWEIFLGCTKYCIMIRRNIQTICIGERWGFFAPILLYLSHIRRAGWGFLRRIPSEFQAANHSSLSGFILFTQTFSWIFSSDSWLETVCIEPHKVSPNESQ